MQQLTIIAAACVGAGVGLFIGILLGKGSADRKKARAKRKEHEAMEAKRPKAISMSNYKRSS